MSVIVAARVRPFTQQEKQKNKGICVEMYNNDILLTNLKNKQEQHAYSLDRVFWSFDGSTMSEGRHVATQGSKYASQELIYDQLARPQVDNAFQGYHSCLFAYGPTGAGKSYTMVGKDKNIGMIGLAVEDIYKRIENDKFINTMQSKTTAMIRLPNKQEQQTANYSICVQQSDNLIVIKNQSQEVYKYQFDYVYQYQPPHNNQEQQNGNYSQIYKTSVMFLVDNLLSASNSCLIAYGAQLSGKDFSIQGCGSELGMIRLGVQDMFNRIKDEAGITKYKLSMSMIWVYDDKGYDLLQGIGDQMIELKFVQNEHGFISEELIMKTIDNQEDFELFLTLGLQSQSQAAAKFNQQSSRAHKIVQFQLNQTNNDGTKLSYLNFVELASVNLKNNLNPEENKRNVDIDQSIKCLFDILQASKDKQNIPNCNCTLTKVLMNSLRGYIFNLVSNSKTAIICTIIPSECAYNQTKQVLINASSLTKPTINQYDQIIKKDLINDTHLFQQKYQQYQLLSITILDLPYPISMPIQLRFLFNPLSILIQIQQNY